MKALKDYIKGRPERWGNLRSYVKDNGVNKKINWIVLILETLFIIYAINSLYNCPCALRTCGLKEYEGDGVTLKWEAYNLDCDFVEKHVSYTNDLYNNEENYLTADEYEKEIWKKNNLTTSLILDNN